MAKPLNIVLLMSDQWRWDTIFEEGHLCQTPDLCRLAEEGQAFRNAFTCCPLCGPARGSLFTGNWPHQNCLTDNVGAGSYYPHGQLHLRYRTYLERLRDSGYAVSYAGKWHLGAGTLHERGIDDVRAGDGGHPRRGRAAGRRSRPDMDGETLEPYYGSYYRGTGSDQRVVELGIEQMAELSAGDRPFCAVISTPGPHFPHYVPAEFARMYADIPEEFEPANYCMPFEETRKPLMQSRPYWPCQDTRKLTRDDWRKTCAHYWAFCTHLDQQFGRLLRRLDELGLADRTVVAFTADHGEMLGAHGKFDKGPDFYEETIHIPLIIRDPERREPAAPDGFVSLRDLFPTLISLAGAESLLTEDERARSCWLTENDHAFLTYDSYQGRQFKLRGIRTERHKYVWSPHDLCELYDLRDDPGERLNVIDTPELAEVQSELHARLMAWMEAEGDYLRWARHLLPPGAYIDGRGVEKQHDHGWEVPADWPGQPDCTRDMNSGGGTGID